MQIFTRGNDKGNIMLMALILIIVLSTLFISISSKIAARNKFSSDYMTRVIQGIEQENKEIRERYDF